MLSKFLDPKNDYAFRKIFGTEKNKDILIHFLNDMLTLREGNPIEDVTFLKTVQDPEIAARKTSIVDILCKDTKGNLFIVEMQVAKTRGFEKRAQYYAAKAYISQMRVKEEYYNLKEVIFLAIADFVMFPEKSAYKSDHVILDKETNEQDLKDFSFTFVELPKFDTDIENLQTMTERWCYFFKHADETTEEQFTVLSDTDPALKHAYEELNRFSWSEEELLTYDQEMKREYDYLASIDQKFMEGKLEGREEGEQIGIKKVAINLLKLGLDKEDISKTTGLSIDEINKLA